MDIKFYREAIQKIKINGDKKYISMHFSFGDSYLEPTQVLHYFDAQKGQRYWYRSKNAPHTYNKVGIQYIKSISRSKFNDEQLQENKHKLFNSIQHVDFGIENKSSLSLFGGMKFAAEETTDEWNDFNVVGFHLAKYQFDFVNKVLIVTDKIKNVDLDKILDEVHEMSTTIAKTKISTVTVPEITRSKDLFVKGWKELVQETIDSLDDDFVKVVLSRQRLIMFKQDIDTNYIFEQLDHDTKNYTIYFENHGAIFVSKTPERLYEIKGKTIYTSAIAGSIPKDTNASQDKKNQEILLHDEKNKYEHQLVADEIIHHLNEFSDDVQYSEMPKILASNFIYHLETDIEAKLKKDVNIFSILERFHPTPATGGLPKDVAMEYIVKKEFGARGLYAAPLGLIHEDNDAEFAVALRSMFIRDRSATLYAGVGIVKDSEVESELEETHVKFKPMMDLLGVNDEPQNTVD